MKKNELRKVASIDLGTNTCLLLVGKKNNSDFIVEIVSDHAKVVRLGQGVGQGKMLKPEAMARTKECLRNYLQILRAEKIETKDVVAIATSQARDAKNGSEFFESVENEFGLKFRILSGEEEAAASFWGSLLNENQNPKNQVVIDIGGGSTEIISMSGGKSIDMGSVRFTEKYFPDNSRAVTDSEFWSCQEAIDRELQALSSWRKKLSTPAELVGVAGTVTTLGQWFLGAPQYNAQNLNECQMTKGDVHRLVEELKWRTPQERELLPGVEAGRADVLLAGALILWRAMEVLDFDLIRVSSRGLRFGVWKI